jgi:hypothetical protein
MPRLRTFERAISLNWIGAGTTIGAADGLNRQVLQLRQHESTGSERLSVCVTVSSETVSSCERTQQLRRLQTVGVLGFVRDADHLLKDRIAHVCLRIRSTPARASGER